MSWCINLMVQLYGYIGLVLNSLNIVRFRREHWSLSQLYELSMLTECTLTNVFLRVNKFRTSINSYTKIWRILGK